MHICTRFAIPCLALLMGTSLPAWAEPLYTITFLPDWLNASAINNAGQMTGVMRVPGGSHAFLYTDGDVRDLGTLGGSYSYGAGINNAGHVMGASRPGPPEKTELLDASVRSHDFFPCIRLR